MGQLDVSDKQETSIQRTYMKKLLADLRALEHMLGEDMIESDFKRIGVEQELVLIDRSWRPATIAPAILAELNDSHFTNELGLFNLEFNVDPLVFEGTCLTMLEKQLNGFLTQVRSTANKCEGEVVLTGILPTLRKSDLDLDNLTPKPRYFELDEALKRLRGGEPIQFDIKGIDELSVKHSSVMLEACNTSFQVHFQVPPKDFARYHNLAQTVAGPVLAAAVNSPLLFGKRLWKETRISVFQEAIDTRSPGTYPRNLQPRVSFGTQWVESSVLEIYQEDVSHFRTFFSMDVDEDVSELLMRGEYPKLKALQLFNSSVYRWMRPCYGITDGKAHLRIENRVFPSGPTVRDEVANAAFWLGLMHGMAAEFEDISKVMDFDNAKSNFFTAATQGMEAQFIWLKGKTIPAKELICKELLPLARKGLEKAGLVATDIDRYLGIVEERTSTGGTGARWILDSFDAMTENSSIEESLGAITAAMCTREKRGQPVHTWSLARVEEAGGWKSSYQRIEQFMNTDVYTVGPDEPIDLVASLMLWKRIRHVPVEDHQHRFVGLISYRSLVKLLLRTLSKEEDPSIPVSSIMIKNPVTISPQSSVLKALVTMKQKRIGCLPVVKRGRLVGLITEGDFTNVARELMEKQLREEVRET